MDSIQKFIEVKIRLKVAKFIKLLGCFVCHPSIIGIHSEISTTWGAHQESKGSKKTQKFKFVQLAKFQSRFNVSKISSSRNLFSYQTLIIFVEEVKVLAFYEYFQAFL